MRQPHRFVGRSERTLATPPGANDDGVVGLHGDHTVELQHAVSIGVAVRGWVDVLGVRARASGELLLPVYHAIVGQKLPCHRPPLVWTPKARLYPAIIPLFSPAFRVHTQEASMKFS